MVSRSIGLRFDPNACRRRIRKHLDLSVNAKAPGMRLADVLDPNASDSPFSNGQEFDWATTVVSADISDETVFRRIAKEMEVFPPEFLLFLPANIELDLEIDGAETRNISKRVEDGASIVGDGRDENRWKYFETRVNVMDVEARADATHTQLRENLPLAWAVPLGARQPAGRFWAFFPTETHNLTSGILNAPWKLNSDRTNLIRGPWNEAIMRAAANLIAVSLPELATSADFGLPVSAFPRQADRQDEIAVPLINSLWTRILETQALAATDGSLQKPSTLERHPIEDSEICGRWAVFAGTAARGRYIHPDCYRFRLRVSRLDALSAEAARRGGDVLNRSTVEDWLKEIAGTEIGHAKQVLQFVAELIGNPLKHGIYEVPQVPLIPASNGRLVEPSRAVITGNHGAPAGFYSVATEIAADPHCKKILIEKFKIKELSNETWDDLLEASLNSAKVDNCNDAWENFWKNLSAAPKSARNKFFSSFSAAQLKFRSVAGTWVERSHLVATLADNNIPDKFLLDLDYIDKFRDILPSELLTEFPSVELRVDRRSDDLKLYLQWASDGFNSICQERVGSTPRFPPCIQGRNFHLPGGWRLLPLLPPAAAARLTNELLNRAFNGEHRFRPVTLVHETRENAYPKLSCPHPLLFHISMYGRLRIGNLIVKIRAIDPELVRELAIVGISEFKSAAELLAAQDDETDLGPRLNWPRGQLSRNDTRIFWEKLANRLEVVDCDFSKLRNLWQKANMFGVVPSKVPTSNGPLPLHEIFVTSDQEFRHDQEDGRIVRLSGECARSWIDAGAQPLTGMVGLSFCRQLSEPAHLLDLFPEFAQSDTLAESLSDLLAVWVDGLEENLGPHRRDATIAMDSGGDIILDQSRFEARDRSNGVELLLRFLSSHRLVSADADLDELLAGLLDRHTKVARTEVRSQPCLAGRLLRAVGNDLDALLEILSPATRQALADVTNPLEVAELVLAVHGPTVLSKLREKLDAQGLSPPRRWGGLAAHNFVLDLGFPAEYASTASGRRDAEFLISGPIDLPPLHSYQEKILDDIRSLVNSSVRRRRAVISLPTGGGKTRVAAEAVVRLILRGDDHRSVLWVAQTDELCEQAVQCFRQLWVNVGEPGDNLRIIRFWGGQKNPTPSESDEAVVVVASIQTLTSRSGRSEISWVADAGIIVIDECHHAIAASYTDLLRWLDVQVGSERSRERESPVLGLSATPWRGYNEEESERLAARFDRRWFPADQAKLHNSLTDMGVLAGRTYRALRYQKPVNLTPQELQHVETFGELPDSVSVRIGEDNDRNSLVVDSVLQSSASSILLFANSVEHAQYLAACLHLKGCPAAAVSGQTSRLARQSFTRRFRSGDLRVICNHSVLTTGFDAPKSDMILISRPVLSPVLYMQMVGRGLRGPKNGGTEHCEIVTVEDNIVNFQDKLAYQFCRRFFGD